MATRRERVFYELTATDNASRVFRQAEGSAASLAGGYRMLQSAVAVLASGAFVRSLVNAAKQGEESQNRLTAALRATGNQVGVTRAELDEMADAMAESTQFDDDGLRNAQAQLAKFGNIQGQIFRDGLKAATDWAAFMGTDVASAAQQVGRALQSPTESLRILERSLGKLTEEEEKHILSLAAQGRAVEAQRAVLDLLERKIGGTAETMNTGLLKSTTGVTKAWDDMLEAWGRTEAVGGRINRMLGGMRDLLKDIEGLAKPANQTAQDRLNELDVLIAGAEQKAGPGIGAGVEGGRGFLGDMPRQREFAIARKNLENLKQQRRELIAQMQSFAGIEAFESGLANTPLAAIKLGGETSDKGAAAAAKLAADRQLQQDVQAAGRSQLAADREAEFLKNMDEALKRQAERISLTHDEQQQVDQLAQKYQMLADREAEFSDPGKLETMLEGLKKVDAAAVDLGWAFSSAFEDAIIGGEKLRDVVQGLAKDIARIILRQAVTQPMATAISGALAGVFGGASATGSVPAFAMGTDYVPRTGLALVHQGERITPAGQNGGGDVNLHLNFSANTPAAVRDAVMAAAPHLVEAAKRGVMEARARGAG
jgi:phage-related minor tail protein